MSNRIKLVIIFLTFTITLKSEFDLHSDFFHDNSDEIDSGNWYEKLQWWKKAKPVYESIQQQNIQLKTQVDMFMERAEKIKNEVEKFYASSRVKQNETQAIIQHVLDDLKGQLEKLESQELTDENKQERSENAQQQKKLEELKNNVDSLGTLMNRINEASVIAQNQIKQGDSYEERSLENFEKIENVLDDKKAKHYYDVIENNTENMQDLIAYVENELRLYLEQSNQRIMDLLPKIKNTLDEFEREGIQLRSLTAEEREKEELLKREKKKIEESKLKALKEKKEEEERWKNMYWFQKIFYWLMAKLKLIMLSIKSIFMRAKPQENMLTTQSPKAIR